MSRAHKRIRLVCLLVIAALLLAGIGVAYGRYSSVIRDTVLFQADKSDPSRAIAIHADGGWRTTAQGVAITFTLKSGAADQRATLRLTATEGFMPADATVTLTVNGADYVGVPETIDAGHPLYDKMGAGTEYRFYTADTECVWAVSDTPYTLTVEGEADASLLRLTATEA